MPKASQYSSALEALTSRNTTRFNKDYSLRGEWSPPPSRPSSPTLSIFRPPVRVNSQFELAKLALSSSPNEFNVKYGFSKQRKTRKRKQRRGTRKNRRSTRSRR